MPKQVTNQQFVLDQMRFSAHGALTELFVLQSIAHYSKLCAEADPNETEGGLFGSAWTSCAQELQRNLQKAYGNTFDTSPRDSQPAQPIHPQHPLQAAVQEFLGAFGYQFSANNTQLVVKHDQRDVAAALPCLAMEDALVDLRIALGALLEAAGRVASAHSDFVASANIADPPPLSAEAKQALATSIDHLATALHPVVRSRT